MWYPMSTEMAPGGFGGKEYLQVEAEGRDRLSLHPGQRIIACKGEVLVFIFLPVWIFSESIRAEHRAMGR
jgi:hypothetical protein